MYSMLLNIHFLYISYFIIILIHHLTLLPPVRYPGELLGITNEH